MQCAVIVALPCESTGLWGTTTILFLLAARGTLVPSASDFPTCKNVQTTPPSTALAVQAFTGPRLECTAKS